MNCICGAKWCQIRDVCSLLGRSEQNGHRRYGGLMFGEQSARYVRPQEGMVLAESTARQLSPAIPAPVPAEEVRRLLREWLSLDCEDPS